MLVFQRVWMKTIRNQPTIVVNLCYVDLGWAMMGRWLKWDTYMCIYISAFFCPHVHLQLYVNVDMCVYICNSNYIYTYIYIYLYRSICLFMYVHYLFFQECDDDSLDREKKQKLTLYLLIIRRKLNVAKGFRRIRMPTYGS